VTIPEPVIIFGDAGRGGTSDPGGVAIIDQQTPDEKHQTNASVAPTRHEREPR